ncbi:MAG: HIT domain-containing protein [Phycisphaerae bacterium]
MNEFPENLWAPWRIEYIQLLRDESRSGCFLCDYRDAPENDAKNHVVWRANNTMVVLNRYPYTNGHMLIAPLAHKEDLDDLDDSEMAALWWQTRDAKALLARALEPHGFNVGINVGRCAGAGLPGHLHIHVVPRWNGDTNFMAVLGDVRVIPQSLERLHERLQDLTAEMGLPRRPGEGET